jgi:hypothetical protein
MSCRGEGEKKATLVAGFRASVRDPPFQIHDKSETGNRRWREEVRTTGRRLGCGPRGRPVGRSRESARQGRRGTTSTRRGRSRLGRGATSRVRDAAEKAEQARASRRREGWGWRPSQGQGIEGAASGRGRRGRAKGEWRRGRAARRGGDKNGGQTGPWLSGAGAVYRPRLM